MTGTVEFTFEIFKRHDMPTHLLTFSDSFTTMIYGRQRIQEGIVVGVQDQDVWLTKKQSDIF